MIKKNIIMLLFVLILFISAFYLYPDYNRQNKNIKLINELTEKKVLKKPEDFPKNNFDDIYKKGNYYYQLSNPIQKNMGFDDYKIEADSKTFRLFSVNSVFGVDKNNLFIRQQKVDEIPNFDFSKLKILGDIDYLFIYNNQLYRIDLDYHIQKQDVSFIGNRIIDISTLKWVGKIKDYADEYDVLKDKNFVYLVELDVSHENCVSNMKYKDGVFVKNRGWITYIMPIYELDPKSLKILNKKIFKDIKGVYKLGNHLSVNCDMPVIEKIK